MTDAGRRPGLVRRLWKALTTPSARWSVLALAGAGVLVGVFSTISTQVVVAATGTNEFCGGACHSMQWVAAEHRASTHGVNRYGVGATCSDCHIPHGYPEKLWYKTQAGIKDMIAEARGVIATEELFRKERMRMAEHVWAEYRTNDSANCRTCHVFTPEVLAKQKGGPRKDHENRFNEKKTCIDCHQGVAHEEPEA
jgi:nitrate/TMAO reductase-like tetraheme cytochrome c subunit